jgi:hypothetical protein
MNRQDAVKSGDSDVVQAIHRIPHHFGANCRFFGDREVRRTRRGNRDCPLTGVGLGNANSDRARSVVESCARKTIRYRTVGLGGRARHQQILAGCNNSFRNTRDLLGSFALAEDDFWKPLADAAVVINPRESEVLERRVAQKLKEPGVRRLRSQCSGVNLVENPLEFKPGHFGKALMEIDFQLIRAVKYPVVLRERFMSV